jgi:hypothetical protein
MRVCIGELHFLTQQRTKTVHAAAFLSDTENGILKISFAIKHVFLNFFSCLAYSLLVCLAGQEKMKFPRIHISFKYWGTELSREYRDRRVTGEEHREFAVLHFETYLF